MPTATHKQRLVNQICTTCGDKEEGGEPEARPVLEQFIYGLCREGTTRERADRAFESLRGRFFDWNEVRVSSSREVEEALAELPDAGARAERLIGFLQEVFETTFSFDLEDLHKKGLKEAAKRLARYASANDYVGAWVLQQSLGGHAIPVDAPTLRTARRLGLIDIDQDDPEALRASLEHLVPKARGGIFVETISRLANDFCREENPTCPACPLAGECPTGQELTREAGVAAGRGGRPKPR